MHTLVRTVFSRLHSLDPQVEESKLRAPDEDTPENEIKVVVHMTESLVLEEESEEVTLESESNIEASVALQSPATSRIDRPQCM